LLLSASTALAAPESAAVGKVAKEQGIKFGSVIWTDVDLLSVYFLFGKTQQGERYTAFYFQLRAHEQASASTSTSTNSKRKEPACRDRQGFSDFSTCIAIVSFARLSFSYS
jgi:hypothetical protein